MNTNVGEHVTALSATHVGKLEHGIMLGGITAGFVGIAATSASIFGLIYGALGDSRQLPMLVTVIFAAISLAYVVYRHPSGVARTFTFYVLASAVVGALIALRSDHYPVEAIEYAKSLAAAYMTTALLVGTLSPSVVAPSKNRSRTAKVLWWVAIAATWAMTLTVVFTRLEFTTWLVTAIALCIATAPAYVATHHMERTVATTLHWAAAFGACYFGMYMLLLHV